MPSKLIRDLRTVPDIIAGLGFAVADAQKAFNAQYLDGVERLLAMTRMLIPNDAEVGQDPKRDAAAGLFKELLGACAPPRYQFTETTLTVKLDLAQSLDVAGGLGIGIGM